MSDQSPSHRARIKVQFWVPAADLDDLRRWREAARKEGIELGPWLHNAANRKVQETIG